MILVRTNYSSLKGHYIVNEVDQK